MAANMMNDAMGYPAISFQPSAFSRQPMGDWLIADR
jgi:hypothetical protein